MDFTASNPRITAPTLVIVGKQVLQRRRGRRSDRQADQGDKVAALDAAISQTWSSRSSTPRPCSTSSFVKAVAMDEKERHDAA